MANNPARKIRVAVLYGGRSREHEVSLQSAASVVRNLDAERFEIVPIGIDKQGRWLLSDVKALGSDQSQSTSLRIASQETALDCFAAASAIDVVFPVLHGTLGEDGCLQGMLEMLDVPYVGPGVLASALGMNKDFSKKLVAAAGLPVPEYRTFSIEAWRHDPASCAQQISAQLGYPVFIKPINTGSSVGVHKVKQAAELSTAMDDAFLYDTKVTVEKGINVREIELAVLENPEVGKPPLVSIPGEVVPTHEFYSYTAKYLDANGAKLLLPAPLNEQQVRQAQQMAGQVFEILDCEGMARVDLFLDKDSGQFIFNEVNTLPGFTQISMYPKLWEASGITYSELLSRLIDLAIARHQRKQTLKQDWALSV